MKKFFYIILIIVLSLIYNLNILYDESSINIIFTIIILHFISYFLKPKLNIMVKSINFLILLKILIYKSDSYILTFDENIHYNILFIFFLFLVNIILLFINPINLNNIYNFFTINANTISLSNNIEKNKIKKIKTIKKAKKIKKTFNKKNISEIITDLPRHNSFKYINIGSLSDEYFEKAYKTLNDKNIYIILSNTGSAASQFIEAFTNKDYAHASISFDKELQTIISYNGGEKINPPGLNQEILDYFNKKEGASIVVYKLKITSSQKKKIIDEVKEINKEGSSYNILGLVFKHSYKPNIMFCSQFVYHILKCADANYFEKKETTVKPTDFLELDKSKKLEFVCEMKLS